MITMSDLLESRRIPGNYFAASAYIRGDLELGLLESRRGDRLLALPETLIEAIYLGLEQETGQAARLVLFNCGRWWGKNFYARFSEEVSEYYGKPLATMEMVEFVQCLQQCWKTLGWGSFELEPKYYQNGFLEVRITHSPYAKYAPQTNRPVCHLEAGILSSFFSQLTGRELHCVQTSCESLQADTNRFILGLPERLKSVDVWLTEGKKDDEIMSLLINQ